MPRFEPMSPRRRRVVFGLLAAIVVVLLLTIWWLDRPIESGGDLAWTGTDFASYPEVDLLRRYIRVDTSPISGSEVDGAEFLAAELKKMGLEPRIERLGEKSANLWAILEGESREAVVLHNHIDTTPFGDEGWDFPPLGAEIDHLWLYGRGAFDMKSVTTAQLLALDHLADLARSGRKPRRSVIFLATGGEEVGSRLGTRWILDQHPELVDRAWAVLTEGGVLEPKSLEEIKYWGIEFAQKRLIEGYLCGQSESELARRAADVIRHAKRRHAPWLAPEVATFTRRYAGSRENPLYNRLLAEPETAFADPRQFALMPDYMKSLFREEIYFFPAQENPGGGGWTTRFLIHLLPGSDPEAAKAALLPAWLTHGATVSFTGVVGAEGGSPLDHEAFVGLVEAVRERHPGAPVGPFFLAHAATDARFFRQAGIPAYGFSPFVIFNIDTFRKDLPNERIGLPGYVLGVELYRDVLVRLAG